MKKTFRFLSMAALALVGAIMTGCSSDDSIISNPQQPENKSKVVTLTTTVGLDGGATTRALTPAGVKTFAAGDQIAIIYKNTSDETKTALSDPLPAGDYGATASFTVSLTDPKASTAVRYIYPAAMLATSVATNSAVDADANVNYAALNSQDGTLASLASNVDLAIFDGTLTDGAALPASASMVNKLAILAITLKDNAATPAEITGSITGLTVSDGTNTYSVTRPAAAGPIYVAIQPTSGADIAVSATDGANSYGKFLSGKTYAANNGYPVSWKMLPRINLSTVSGYRYYVNGDVILTGTPPDQLDIEYKADNCEVTLDNVNPDGTKETCILGYNYNVNVKLKGTSRLEIISASDGTVTIGEAEAGGEVILISESTTLWGSTVTINGGTVKAKNTIDYPGDDLTSAVNGNLVINGGAVYLAGGTIMGEDGKAVNGSVTGTGTLYGWGGSAWGSYLNQRYATTDNTSGDPTGWTW